MSENDQTSPGPKAQYVFMTEDAELCYRAIASRDPRFDGRFFTGVRTTGIYCRPICPARTPKRENVTFFACAAAAEEAGFRPCRRCRPDTAPGTPEWNGTSASVSRGLRLIQQGALDEADVSMLAERLGMGERHLSRLFGEHLGASPVTVAQTRRTHFARKLIEETDLSMAEIAFASGFGSVRRFNALIRDRFGFTPTELRRTRRKGTTRDAAHGPKESRSSRNTARRPNASCTSRDGDRLALRLSYRPPFDWDGILAFQAKRLIPGVEQIRDHGYERTFAMGETTGRLRVTHAPEERALLLTVSSIPPRKLLWLVETTRHVFDLHADPMCVTRHFDSDPMLGPFIGLAPGLRVPGAWDGFELAVRAILGQQITVRAATTLAHRLVARLGNPLEKSGETPSVSELHMLFPRPEIVANADLSGLGIPGSRIAAIQSLARAVADERLTLDPAAPADETRRRLLEIPGIGAWTVEYIMMRAVRDPDAFPAGDIVLRRICSTGSAPLSEKQLMKRAEPWRPWRAYSVLHLWRAASRAATASANGRTT
jgi:AraC family transcriptional regulator of adaptative response / DNA-3-methyladenine glycosylase II